MTKSDIKKWLEQIGKDRIWLAEQCGVTKHTVNGWLSASKPIPKPKQALIGRLMSGKSDDESASISVQISDELRAKAEKQAEALGFEDADAWISDLVRKMLG